MTHSAAFRLVKGVEGQTSCACLPKSGEQLTGTTSFSLLLIDTAWVAAAVSSRDNVEGPHGHVMDHYK